MKGFDQSQIAEKIFFCPAGTLKMPLNLVKPQNPDMVAKAIMPDYALGNHTASLGVAFYYAALLPEHYKDGALLVADDVGNIIRRLTSK